MNTVIIVNGRPRVGKDSAIAAMENILRGSFLFVDSFSSIDPVREMLTLAGFDLTEKTEADRALLAMVGDAVELHSKWRTQKCIWAAQDLFDDAEKAGCDGALFLHVREPVIINRITERLRNQGVTVLRILITGPRGLTITSNAADAGVEDIEYDDTLPNDGDLTDLAYKADQLLFRHKVIEQPSLLR